MRALLCSVAVVLTVPSLFGANFEAGMRSLESSDYVSAMHELRPLAEQGLAEAQLEIGFLFLFGEGVPRDEAEATKWLVRAAAALPEWRQLAEKGDTQSQLRVGVMLWTGRGVPQDLATARRLVSKAAEQGDLEAQLNLAYFRLKGDLFEKNEQEAARWCQRAAERGYAPAEDCLGGLYLDGTGVKQDFSQAEFWLRRAAQQGSLDAYNNLAWMYLTGRVGAAPNSSEAVRLYKLAAEKSFAPAMVSLGAAYEQDDGASRDVVQAALWYLRAAQQGDAEGQLRLGLLFRSGRGVKQDFEQAVGWFQKAALADNIHALFELGKMYELGWGVSQDLPTAVSYLSRAATGGLAEAQHRLGHLYRTGKGLKQDYIKARELLLNAAQKGSLPAENELGFMLANGEGSAQDASEAAKWFLQAANRGFAASQYNLGVLYAAGKLPRNPSTAAFWVRRAAEQGYRNAEFLLGSFYRDGTGVPKDYVQAYLWLNLAAASGDSEAAKRRDDLEKQMTPERIGEAQDLTAKWKPQPSVDSAEDLSSARNQVSPTPELASTGTGFFVTREGHLVTNFHVVDGCTALFTELAGKPQAFSLTAIDPKSDLALLKLADFGGAFATFRSGHEPGLGEPVLAAGYPLPGLLASTLNVTTGNISALAGIGNDSSKFQISAPVQPGNSGGPLLDHNANVVGVVVSKLNALNLAKENGDIAQNVNFAIKGSVVQSFLRANGVRYSTALSQATVSPTETSRRASTFTVLVECWK